MARFREHRRLLHDALETTFEFETQRELFEHLARKFPELADRLDDIAIDPFGDDDRCGWKDVRLLSVRGYGALGFAENWR